MRPSTVSSDRPRIAICSCSGCRPIAAAGPHLRNTSAFLRAVPSPAGRAAGAGSGADEEVEREPVPTRWRLLERTDYSIWRQAHGSAHSATARRDRRSPVHGTSHSTRSKQPSTRPPRPSGRMKDGNFSASWQVTRSARELMPAERARCRASEGAAVGETESEGGPERADPWAAAAAHESQPPRPAPCCNPIDPRTLALVHEHVGPRRVFVVGDYHARGQHAGRLA